jgi:hypothetical protein
MVCRGLWPAILIGFIAAIPAAAGSPARNAEAEIHPPASSPPLLGIVGSKLVALDPATLRPLASPRPLAVGRLHPRLRPVLSPDGRHVAIPGARGLSIVDRVRLRLLPKVMGAEYPEATAEADYTIWTSDRKTFVFLCEGCSTLGLALHFFGPYPLPADADIGTDYWVRTPDGLAVLIGDPEEGDSFWLYSPEEGRQTTLPFRGGAAAVDARRNRMFVVSSAGRVAIVNLKTLAVTTRSLALPETSPDGGYRVAWAGGGQLALWGRNGLSVIDTRDWSARMIDEQTREVRVGANALVTWNGETATGLTVYSPDGTMRFRALEGRRVSEAGVTARYAYVEASGRFSIDLRTGRVRGPLASRAALILPDLLSLP